MIEIGDICRCYYGELGVVTKIKKNELTFVTTYTGIHLSPERFGQKWQSTKPSPPLASLLQLLDIYMGHLDA